MKRKLITEIEKDYEETDYGESYYSGSHYGGYSDYYVLPWCYSITPVTVVSGGSSDDTPTHTTVVRKRDKESLNLRNRDGGRNSSGDGTGSSATEVPEIIAQEPLQPHQHQPNPHQVMIVAAEAVEVQMTVKEFRTKRVRGGRK
ncbi:MAG: hypothetical protein IPN18_09730 [Ignavibacteriales bacterium]|nr:hypothetical protein [Ignavibacteriales bacterium]